MDPYKSQSLIKSHITNWYDVTDSIYEHPTDSLKINLSEYLKYEVDTLTDPQITPISPSTTIECNLSNRDIISLEFFDSEGKHHTKPIYDSLDAGLYFFRFQGNMASGVYYYRMFIGNNKTIKKFIVMK